MFAPDTTSSMPSSAESTPKQIRTPQGFVDGLSSALEPTPPSRRALSSQPQISPSGKLYPANKSFGAVNGPKPGLSKYGSYPAPEAEQPTYEADAMDWTPTTSSHRAFQPTNLETPSKTKLFGDSPTAPDQGPFWYKAPGVPQHPAHKLRNAPRMPVINSQAETLRTERSPVFGKTGLPAAAPFQSPRGVTFNQPKFFANEPNAEEANSLADMFGGTFSVREEASDNDLQNHKPGIFALAEERRQFEEQLREEQARQQSKEAIEQAEASSLPPSPTLRAQMLTRLQNAGFIALWGVWISCSWGGISHPELIRLAVLGLSALLGVCCILSLVSRMRDQQVHGVLPLLFITMRAGEVAGTIWAIWHQMLKDEGAEGWGGFMVCLMMAHQVVESAL